MPVAALLIGSLLAVLPVQDPTKRVHDRAGLLSPTDATALESLAREVEQRTTAQMAIVTVTSLEGKTVDAYAHELFNAWGIGQNPANNGVLLLVAPNERRMRIEVGYGLEPLLTDSLCGEIRDQQIVPCFRASDYAGGIMAGARRLADIMLADPAAARGDPNSGPILARTAGRRALTATVVLAAAALALLILGIAVAAWRLYSTVTFLLVSIVGLAVLAIAVYYNSRAPLRGGPAALLGVAGSASLAAWGFNLKRYRRFGPHGCSKCGTRLELLGEQAEDPKLSAVQRLEEQIGSVDYDVWICPACLNADTDRYLKPFSSFGDCPACKGRTFKEDPPRTIRAPTTSKTGLAEAEGRCVSCNHKSLRRIVLAVVADSSTNSSSFFAGGGGGGSGGGSSFGGGASGGGALRGAGSMYFTFAAVTLAALAVLWYVLAFNSLVAARNAVDQAWSHIEVELTRRFDLIHNLVEIAKGYARHDARHVYPSRRAANADSTVRRRCGCQPRYSLC